MIQINKKDGLNMKENNQFLHDFVWDSNGVGRVVVKLNDSFDYENTNSKENNDKK